MLKGAYLNNASTAAKRTGQLNPSDIGYPQNIFERSMLEDLKVKIKKFVNAPLTSEVIINSGSSESIANCIFWAKSLNPHGTISGSIFDHPVIEANCDNMDMEYSQEICDKTCAIFITHVNPKTGEIYDVDDFITKFNLTYRIIHKEGFDPYNSSKILQYKPLMFLDAAQSITKIPIDMEGWRLDAVFFSLHKIGGPQGLGIFVIDTRSNFKPLIAGFQQNSMRGGTLNILSLIEYEDLFEKCNNSQSQEDKWVSIKQEFDKAGLSVYNPKHKHLNNTFLISTHGKCPLNIINKLARKEIYVGNVSACENEKIDSNEISNPIKIMSPVVADVKEKSFKGASFESDDDMLFSESTIPSREIMSSMKPFKNSYKLKGSSMEFDKAVRITFANTDELKPSIIHEIIKVMKEEL
jgi:cysteine sulfinate desulfinase/cysteine desulfurase-like protein